LRAGISVPSWRPFAPCPSAPLLCYRRAARISLASVPGAAGQ
jgi:hypothetical protein